MSESSTNDRPSQVTMAGWLAVVGSAFLLMTLFEMMSQVRSLEMRNGIEEFLAQPPGDGLGLTVDGTIDIMRTLMFVAGAATAVALVLAIYVLQRNNSARVGFTIAAVPIALTAPISGGFLPVVIVFAASMLWTRPARDWFAGRSGSAASDRAHPSGSGPHGPRDHGSDHPRSDGVASSGERPSEPNSGNQEWPRMPDSNSPSDRPVPPPTEGYGSATPPPHPQQGPYGPGDPGQGPYDQGQPGPGYPQGGQYPPQYGQQGQSWPPPAYGQQPQPYGYSGYAGYGGYGQQEPEKRPTTVTVAAWLTWIFSGLTTLVYLLIVLMLLVAQDQLVNALEQEPAFQEMNIDPDTLIAVLWVMSAVLIFWCLSAIALAVLAFRRVNWARITLVVSAATATLFSLAAFPFGLVNTLAAGAAVVLLFVGGANQWYSRKGGGPDQPAYYPPQQYGDPQQQHPQQHDPQQQHPQDPPKNVW